MAVLGLDTPKKQGIFTTYVSLWVSSHLLVYGSRLAGAPAYNATSVVLLTELTKLLLACGLYVAYDGSLADLARSTAGSVPLLLRYTVPAVLYCIYNNLVYINLTAFDPGTYNVLMQLRIGMTGLLWQVLFSKRLNHNQWIAVGLICSGCMIKESAKLAPGGGGLAANLSAWLLLLVQMLASVFASLYNEVLLKGGGERAAGLIVTTNLQNAFMYLQSVVWNGIFLAYQGRLGEAFAGENLAAVCSPTVVAIIAIMSSVGLVTGFFLKHLDSVLKSVASALEVVVTMIASFLLFGTPINAPALLAAMLVGAGVALYSKPIAPSRHEPPPTALFSSLEPMELEEFRSGKSAREEGESGENASLLHKT